MLDRPWMYGDVPPAGFGGTTTGYRFTEEEDDGGRTRLSLALHIEGGR